MKMNFRQRTIDSIVFEEIFKYDQYKLPHTFSEEDVIVDIGAHVGYFTYAVVQRGCRHVYAFEPDRENYYIATEHLKHFINQGYVFLTPSAVWRSDVNDPVVYHSGYFAENHVVNTGGGIVWSRQGNPVPTIPFDTAILHATEGVKRRIRLVKLDCEGSEWPILLTSGTLHLVDAICGEFHEIVGRYGSDTLPFSIKGVDHFTILYLANFLEEKGFHVVYSRRLEADGTPSRFGTFFATRPSRPSAEDQQQPLRTAVISTQQPLQVKCGGIGTEELFLKNILPNSANWAGGIAFSPDGSKLLTDLPNNTLRLWEITNGGQLLAELKGHTDVVRSIAFSPDSSKIVTGSSDGTARLWEARSGQLLTTLVGHTNWVIDVAFSPDGSKIVTGSYDRTARLWEVTSGRMLVVLADHTDVVRYVAFSSDGSRILTGSYDGIARLWEAASGQLLAKLEDQTGDLKLLTISNTWYTEQENKGGNGRERYWNPWRTHASSTQRSSS